MYAYTMSVARTRTLTYFVQRLTSFRAQGGFECTLLFDGALVLLKYPQLFGMLFSQEVALVKLEIFAHGAEALRSWQQVRELGCVQLRKRCVADDDVWSLILFLVDINKCVCEVAVRVSNQTRAYEFESTWHLWLRGRTACARASRLVSKAWYSWRMLSATPAYTYAFPFLWHTRCLASATHASQLSIQLTQQAMLCTLQRTIVAVSALSKLLQPLKPRRCLEKCGAG